MKQGRPKLGRFSIWLALLFLSGVGVATGFSWLPLQILIGYLSVSLFTYLVYAWDKSAAKRHAWRVRERNLHLLALFGGWPGALIAQQQLRHKSLKQPFRSICWLTVGLNLAGSLWLMTPEGMRWWRGFVEYLLL